MSFAEFSTHPAPLIKELFRSSVMPSILMKALLPIEAISIVPTLMSEEFIAEASL